MSARHALYLYLALVPLPTLVHDARWLAFALGIALAAAGQQRWRFLKRSLIAILAFNLSVSLGYVAIGLWRGEIDTDWLLLANLRVLLMVYLSVWFVARVDVVQALAGWPTLSRVLVLALGQIRLFERTLADFRLAFASRNPRPQPLDEARLAAAQAQTLLDKAIATAGESAQAMRSRGVFDD